MRVLTKNKNCWEFLREFSKIFKKFLQKFAKIHYFSIFFKKLTNLCVHFLPFGQKTQIVGKFWENFEIFWWKLNRKIAFLIIFGNFVTKNIAFGNNTSFLQQFFRLPRPPPQIRLWLGVVQPRKVLDWVYVSIECLNWMPTITYLPRIPNTKSI